MNTNPLPDLSTWHEVPDDADVPEKQPVVFVRPDGEWGVIRGGSIPLIPSDRIAGSRYFTADPIPAPRPAPPTEPGTALLDVATADGATWDRAYFMPTAGDDDLPWRVHSFSTGGGRWRRTDDLVSWTVADVTPRKADPLDESDHRDRIADGNHLSRRDCGRWHWHGADKCPLKEPARHDDTDRTLADWGQCGPVRFADEVQS